MGPPETENAGGRRQHLTNQNINPTMRASNVKSWNIKATFVVPLLIGWLSFPEPAKGQNGLIREVYLGAGGSLANLTNNAAFPDSPSGVGVIPDFEAPQNIGSNYGQRVRGYLMPPQTGNYTFWIASDDASILYLSSDESPANKVPVANVNFFTGFRQWDTEPNQQSQPRSLEEGERYYIEALMAEGSGDDHLSVRWQGPDLTFEEPIPGSRLLAELIPPQIFRQPADVKVTERQSAAFSLQVNNLGPVNYQWQRNGANIPEGTNSLYTLPVATMADDGVRFRAVVSNLFGTNTSAEAILTVERDTTPPSIVSVLNPGDNNLVTVVFSEPVEVSSATNPVHYTIADKANGIGIDVQGAALDADGRTVVLTTAPLSIGATYVLTVNEVFDRADQPNSIDPDTQREFLFGFLPLDRNIVLGGKETLGPSSRRTGLVISEIMYHPAARTDGRNLEFIELHNTQGILESVGGFRLSGAIEYTFPPGTFISPGGYLVVAPSPADLQVIYGLPRVYGGFTNQLQNSSGTVRLHNQLGAVLLEAGYDGNPPWPVAADGAGHSVVLARPSFGERDPKAWAASEVVGGSPGREEPAQNNPFRSVVINEFLAHTDDPELDYIELYNYSAQAVNLAGCFLTDDPDTNKFQIKTNAFRTSAVIPAFGFVAFDQNELGFALSSQGESIFLISPQRTRVIDAVRFEGQANGISTGRYPDGAPVFRQLSSKTPGAANGRPWRSDVVINEIMFNPVSNNEDDEYVELYNRGTAPVNMSGWRFNDGIEFALPANTILPAGGYLVIAKNAGRMRTNYSNLNAANALGNFRGNLSNAGERLVLARPDPVITTNQNNVRVTNVIEIVVDEVTYGEGGRWGQWADGGGSSLELKDPQSDNDFPSNWGDSDETAKSAWTTNIIHTGVLDHGNTNYPADSLHVFLLGRGECLVDDVEVVNSTNAAVNLILNPNFETGLKDWVVQGNHRTSDLETREGFNSAQSLHLRAAQRGDPAANRIRTRLRSNLPNGSTATLRAKARWLRGHPEILLRLHGNYLEAPGTLQIPKNLGTPGLVNSQFVANAGPAIVKVSHAPTLPAANQSVIVSAYVTDVHQISSMLLNYRLDPATNFTSVGMSYNGAGFYSGIIPGQAAGRLAAFHLQATDIGGAKSTFPNDAPARECLVFFGETQPSGRIGTYRIWLTQRTINTWVARERGSNEELDATFVYGNERVVYNMGADYSGSPFHWGNYDSPVGRNCNYVMVFPDDDLFLGVTDFVLNAPSNLGNDNTAIREQTFYWMANELGQPTTYRRFHYLFVNGLRRGSSTSGFIFEDAQQPNREFIEEWFPNDADGDFYKIEDWFEFNDAASSFRNVDATLENFTTTGGVKKLARYRWMFRKRSVQDSANNYTNLFALVDAVNTPPALGPDAYTAAVEALVDVDQWLTAIAIRHVVGDWDAYGYRRGKNMYAYKPQNGKWQLLHWDIAFAMGLGDNPFSNLFDVSHFSGTIDPVTDRMLKHPPFVRAYWRALQEAANGPLLASRVNSILDAKYNALASNGIQVTSPDVSVKAWITQRRSFILSQLSSVSASFAITSNNGNNFSTNKNQITLTGTAPVEIKTIKVNGATFPVTWTSVNSWTLRYALPGPTNNLVIQGFDNKGNPVSEAFDNINVAFTGATEKAEDRLVINEIMYNPAVPDAEFVELHNTSRNFAFDLSYHRLSGIDFAFSEGTLIPPGGFLVIVKDPLIFAETYGNTIPVTGIYDGILDKRGETLSLVKRGVTATNDIVVESVTYDNDPPWPSAANGVGASLQLIDPARDASRVANWAAVGNSYTPGATNSVLTNLSAFPLLWLNEVEPNNVTGTNDLAGERDPWVELHNSGNTTISLANYYLTDSYTNLTQWAFPSNAVIGAKKFLLVWLDGKNSGPEEAELHTGFRIHPVAGSIALTGTLTNGQLAVFDYLNYSNLEADRSFGAFPDGQAQRRQVFYIVTPGATNNPTPPPLKIFINEWMAGNTGSVLDPADDDSDDWFELYNPNSETVDLAGYTLTDNLSNPAKFRIPEGTLIGPTGFLLVWADEETGQTGLVNNDLHVNFKLSQSGEVIGLYAPDGRAVDTVTFSIQTNDVSQGRSPDGSNQPLVFFANPTAGRSNVQQSIRLEIVEVTAASGTISITWSSQPSAVYQIQYNDSLNDADWSAFGNVTATDVTSSITDTLGPGQHRFYRVLKL